MKKIVQFSTIIKIIYEPEHLALEFKLARQSNFVQRTLDKMRMEKMLTPIFDKKHRLKIQERNNML